LRVSCFLCVFCGFLGLLPQAYTALSISPPPSKTSA
jgi:hypothetical protein